eukprot:05380.XXX_257317_258796_1 [CDS] Oithona nana genome sequencing.
MNINGDKAELIDDSEFQVRVINDHEGLDDKHRRNVPHDQFTDKIDRGVIVALLSWYFWSALTLFLNKYIIDRQDGDSALLSCIQMSAVIILGCLQRRHPLALFSIPAVPSPSTKIPLFSKDMVIIGSFRFITVFLGLYALKYVEVSFTETVKSTAPAFTLLVSSFILKEKTSLMVKISILPVMGGLALCSANEAKFNFDGFIFAIATNLSECIQNVLSKRTLSLGTTKHNPGEMQYHSGMGSLFLQLPTLFIFSTDKGWADLSDPEMCITYLINGICFHFQTISAYALMEAISPVTHSVANTVKRALLIWISVIIFKNTITFYSGLGTMIVFVGVLMYNKARHSPYLLPNLPNHKYIL